jgi:hypothetical protein
MIFYATYKKQPKHFYYLRFNFAARSLEVLFLTYVPLLCGKALGNKGGLAMWPGTGRRRFQLDSGELAGARGRERAGQRSESP